MTQIFLQFAIVLIIALAISFIVRIFKQPAILGYILAGIAISPFIIGSGISTDTIKVFTEFGIAFLLFTVGLHLNPRVIKEIGFSSLGIGILQIILTTVAGVSISLLLGFNFITSLFVGVGVAFSSTIVVMKLLSDENKVDSLSGKISTGVLIVQDIVAILILITLSTLTKGKSLMEIALGQVVYGVLALVIIVFLGFFIVPKIARSAAKSQELLFLFSICWCFAVAALFSYIGFSLEIGALIAGIILSVSEFSIDISSKVKPLRDFFLIIFFIILGLNMQLSSIGAVIIPAIILSLAVILLKPLIIMIIMRSFHYTKRTNFLTGITLAQVSEFSLIILALAITKGYVMGEILSMLTLTTVITIAISTYGIIYGDQIYKIIAPGLKPFETKRSLSERKERLKKDYEAILFGYNRIGFGILNSLQKIKKNYLVVDFNPETISTLEKLKIPCLYGDISDPDLIEELPMKKAKLVVSTVPEFEANYLLIDKIRKVNKNVVIIVRAHQISEALDIYKKGANYVLTQHFLGGM
ncbi:Glutathione-regulated potassium-efflux system protein KefB [uncultured archaeon]|nr:Glutathione-regulated potassium-efflux system protein KefB [uncultured archaeon]